MSTEIGRVNTERVKERVCERERESKRESKRERERERELSMPNDDDDKTITSALSLCYSALARDVFMVSLEHPLSHRLSLSLLHWNALPSSLSHSQALPLCLPRFTLSRSWTIFELEKDI